jgi:hypothetical protein
LLDALVLVERVDCDFGTPGHHLGGELALGVLADLAREDELDFFGAADVEVIGDGGLLAATLFAHGSAPLGDHGSATVREDAHQT